MCLIYTSKESSHACCTQVRQVHLFVVAINVLYSSESWVKRLIVWMEYQMSVCLRIGSLHTAQMSDRVEGE